MPFDHTGNVIVICAVAAALYSVIELVLHKDIKVMNSALIFLTFYGATAGYELLSASLEGNIDNLPTSWREYLGAAGVVSIGLSVQHLISSIKKLTTKNANADEV